MVRGFELAERDRRFFARELLAEAPQLTGVQRALDSGAEIWAPETLDDVGNPSSAVLPGSRNSIPLMRSDCTFRRWIGTLFQQP